jgi:hypothetical protein
MANRLPVLMKEARIETKKDDPRTPVVDWTNVVMVELTMASMITRVREVRVA